MLCVADDLQSANRRVERRCESAHDVLVRDTDTDGPDAKTNPRPAKRQRKYVNNVL